MLFTDRLRHETKISHQGVDAHPFISEIRKSPNQAIKYMLFNECCIHNIQQTLDMSDNKPLESLLFRDCTSDQCMRLLYCDCPEWVELLQACRDYPMEHAYMFYLGLLAGGNMLRRYIPNSYQHLLEFGEDGTDNYSRKIITEFKNYLNSKITDTISQEAFINRVQQSFQLISKCFDKL